VHFFKFSMMVVLMAASLSAMAADLKIGVVDGEKIINEAPQVIALRESMESEFTQRRKDLLAEQEAFKQQGEAYQRDKAVLNEDKRKQKEKELIGTQQTLMEKQQKYQMDVQKRQSEGMRQFQQKIRDVIEEIASAEKYDLVVTDPAYFNPKLDITAKVLAKLKK